MGLGWRRVGGARGTYGRTRATGSRSVSALVQFPPEGIGAARFVNARAGQRDLATSVVLTRSGISRLIDRLEAAGLARRDPNPADRRGDLIVLTELGRGAVRRTWPVYARSIAEHFARYVSAEEARVLTTALERVRATELPSSAGPIDSIAS